MHHQPASPNFRHVMCRTTCYCIVGPAGSALEADTVPSRGSDSGRHGKVQRGSQAGTEVAVAAARYQNPASGRYQPPEQLGQLRV